MSTSTPSPRHRERQRELTPRRQGRRPAAAAASPAGDAEALLARAPRKERKLRRLIAQARTPKQRNAAQHRHMRSFHTRVAAVVVATRKKGRDLSPAEVVEVAERLDLDRTHPVRAVLVPKVAGGVRVAWAYEVEGRAVQEIARWQLQAATRPPEWQYALGGRSQRDLVEEVAQDLRDGARWVLVADIKNCYPSFDVGRTAAVLPLPRRLARSALAGERRGAIPESTPGSRPWDYATAERSWERDLARCGTLKPVADSVGETRSSHLAIPTTHTGEPPLYPARTICQGSATAPLAVSIGLGDLDRLMPADANLRAWSDNLVVTARTRRDAERAREVLADALRRSPLGRLRFGYMVVRRRDWGLNLLGFHVRSYGERVSIAPAPWSRARGELRVLDALARDVQAGDEALPRTRQSVRGWMNYYRGCAGVESWGERTLALAEVLAALAPWPEPAEPPEPRVRVRPPRIRRRSAVFPDPSAASKQG